MEYNRNNEPISDEEDGLLNRIAAYIHRHCMPSDCQDQTSVEDLKHYGVVGLLNARMRYDRNLGVAFSTFATYRIRGEILDSLSQEFSIRVPKSAWQKIRQLREATDLLKINGNTVNEADLMRFLGWELAELREVQRSLIPSLVPIDVTVEGEDTKAALNIGHHLPREYDLSQLLEVLDVCINRLPTQELLVFIGRRMEGLTLQQMADNLGVSAQWVKQLETRATEQVLACLQKHNIDFRG